MKQGIVCQDIDDVRSRAEQLTAVGINLAGDVRKFSADMAGLIDAGANIAAVAGVVNELGNLADQMTETIEKAGKDFCKYLDEVAEIGSEQLSLDEEGGV